MTKWTPELIARIRDLAAQGYAAKHVASLIGANVVTLSHYACLHRIPFQRRPARDRPSIIPAAEAAAGVPPGERLRQMARADLDHQIALARAEARTAPIYRGGNT
jgi:hypothetical protein